MTAASENIAIIVMGVCGVGKTSVGRTLADQIGARFIEADDLHSSENLTAMENGIPLTDEMRLPWLESLCLVADEARKRETVVMACSALKRSYRDLLRDGIGKVQFVFLHGDHDVVARRIDRRKDHFMPRSLLDSQLATLEKPTPDEHVLAFDITSSKSIVDEMVERAVRARLTHHQST